SVAEEDTFEPAVEPVAEEDTFEPEAEAFVPEPVADEIISELIAEEDSFEPKIEDPVVETVNLEVEATQEDNQQTPAPPSSSDTDPEKTGLYERMVDQVDERIKPAHLQPAQTGQLSPEVLEAFERQRSAQQAEPETAILKASFSLNQGAKGLLEIIDDNPERQWSEDDVLLAEQVADQLSLALENANLFQQTQSALAEADEQARRLALLNEMSNRVGQANKITDIYDTAIEQAHKIFKAKRSCITLLTSQHTEFEVYGVKDIEDCGPVENRTPVDEWPGIKAIRENNVIIINSFGEPQTGNVNSFMAGPIMVGGDAIGTLNVGHHHANYFTERDKNFMQQILAVLSSTLENRRLFTAIEQALDDAEEQGRRLALLNQMAEQISQTTVIQDICEIGVLKALQIIQPDHVSLGLLRPDKKDLEVLAVQGVETNLTAESIIPLHGDLKIAVQERRLILGPGEGTNLENFQATMIVPVMVGSEVIGTLHFGRQSRATFTPGDQNMALQVTSLLSSSIENTRLLQQILRRSSQLQASAEVSRSASVILDTEELFGEAVELIREGFFLYYAGLFLVDQSGQWTGEPNRWAVLRAGTGEPGELMIEAGHKLEIGGTSMIGAAISRKEARISLDVGTEEIFRRNPYLPDTRSEMALPLISRGVALGALTIQSTEEAAWSQEDITALQTMADQLANAIENARLFEQTQARAEELTVLNEMARAFTQILDVQNVVSHIYQYSSRLIDATNFYVALYDEEEDLVEFPLFVRQGESITPEQPRRKAGNGITEWVIRNREPLHIPENVENWLWEMDLEAAGDPAESWMGVPMLSGNQVIGVIAAQNYEKPRYFNTHHLDLLGAVANQAAIAILNARLFQEAQSRAHREQILREITTQVHSSADADTILRTAVREVSNALGRRAFVYIGDNSEPQPKNTNSHAAEQISEEDNAAV
ncbi:MAG: GAF domain-containing protein, partial [Anaerolineales bacterium]|nr:GAF domain-containing protein [Anaerolineales bacterium]